MSPIVATLLDEWVRFGVDEARARACAKEIEVALRAFDAARENLLKLGAPATVVRLVTPVVWEGAR